MSTIEAAPDTAHDDHGHDHPSYLAHHFDTPEQQYDSGKLGIWLFLVTEILFFSGMFCAYAIFRMLRPDVFEGCSQFLNTKLGAINTGVLLFSSLTMAWAVRCSQTEEHKGLTGMLAATLSCAMIFLGVKAIEYSHKWGMGLLPAGLFTYDPANPHPADHPNYLFWICLPFLLLLVGVVAWLVISIVRDNKFHVDIAKPLSVACLCFFVGVGLGTILESGGSEGHGAVHAGEGEHADAEHAHTDADHAAAEHGSEDHNAAEHSDDAAEHAHALLVAATPEAGGVSEEELVRERFASDATNSGLKAELAAREQQTAVAGSSVVSSDAEISGPIATVEEDVMTPSKAGVFFSIYYCMTGVHAVHILAGIGFLVWLLVRSVRRDFNKSYFGPVDYVGLYWHLVDLIWIYLFPLLYLIR